MFVLIEVLGKGGRALWRTIQGCAVRQLGGAQEVVVRGTDWAVDEIAKSRRKAIIRTLRFPHNQYVWINEVRNYSGGPGYAVRAVHVAEPETEGMPLSTDMADIRGNLPYKEELEGVVAHGDIFFTYYFKKPDSDEISEKLTYAKLYKPFNWIVCTGSIQTIWKSSTEA